MNFKKRVVARRRPKEMLFSPVLLSFERKPDFMTTAVERGDRARASHRGPLSRRALSWTLGLCRLGQPWDLEAELCSCTSALQAWAHCLCPPWASYDFLSGVPHSWGGIFTLKFWQSDKGLDENLGRGKHPHINHSAAVTCFEFSLTSTLWLSW